MYSTQPGDLLAELIFWACLSLVVYVYAGYPALVWAASKLIGQDVTPPAPADVLPVVSIIVAAHNEESVIEERITNLLALDYPPDRVEILIASDGSTDRTGDIVRRFESDRVRLLDFKVNRGKTAVLNDAFAQARGSIAILSDANTMHHPQAARLLVRWFNDSQVGIVCGRLVLSDPLGGENADGVYWRYETFLKRCESRLGALLGANGAIYAMRVALFRPLPPRIAVDDFVIPLLAHLHSGSRIVYDNDALAYEETPSAIRSEFSRRSRIGAGGFQSLSLLWPLANPRRGWMALSFVSHKLLRWICPFFLVGALVTSGWLVQHPLYLAACAGQLALYTVALAVYLWPALGSVHRLVRVPTLFAAMNLALLAGFFQWAARRQGGVWQRTERT
jgi:cellulose synthase/poly-beta-1,6-N-acetylglucosamine synthase-like glycosyltransferase